MDFDIREIGATLLVGAFILLVLEGILSFVFRIDLTGFYRGEFFGFPGNNKSESPDGRRQYDYPVPFGLFLAISLVIGLIGENIALSVVEDHPRVISRPAAALVASVSAQGTFLGVPFSELSSKRQIRSSVLITTKGIKLPDRLGDKSPEAESIAAVFDSPKTRAAGSCPLDALPPSCRSDTAKLCSADCLADAAGQTHADLRLGCVSATVSPLGHLVTQLPDDPRLCPSGPNNLFWKQLRSTGSIEAFACDPRWDYLWDCLNSRYYDAKNRVYLESTLFDELRRIDIRRKLSSSFAFFALAFLGPTVWMVLTLMVWRTWQHIPRRAATAAAIIGACAAISWIARALQGVIVRGDATDVVLLLGMCTPYAILLAVAFFNQRRPPEPDTVDPTRGLTWIVFLAPVATLGLRVAHKGITEGFPPGRFLASVCGIGGFVAIVFAAAGCLLAWLVWKGFCRIDAWPKPWSRPRTQLGGGLTLASLLAMIYVGGLHASAFESNELIRRVFGYYATIAKYEAETAASVPGTNPFLSDMLAETLAKSRRAPCATPSGQCGPESTSGKTPDPRPPEPTPSSSVLPTGSTGNMSQGRAESSDQSNADSTGKAPVANVKRDEPADSSAIAPVAESEIPDRRTDSEGRRNSDPDSGVRYSLRP
jgi:hypothetical protein